MKETICHWKGCKKKIRVDDSLGKGNTMPIGHTCSCHGVKPNTYLKKGIKKYQKFLRTLPKTVDNMYRRKEIQTFIRSSKKAIEENPKNLLWWQLEDKQTVVAQ